MKIETLLPFAVYFVGMQITTACAPNGNINKLISNDCPVVLGYDFTSSSPSSQASFISGATLVNGTVNATLTNPHTGSTSTGVWSSVGSQQTMTLQFSTTQALDLEAIQLLDYWSTEPTASASWDRIQAKIFINGVQVGATGTSNSTAFRGYKGNITTGLNSNDYWEFGTNSVHTPTLATLSANAGDVIKIELRSTNTVSNNNILAIGGLNIHACSVPEPSSAMLLAIGSIGLTIRRKRS